MPLMIEENFTARLLEQLRENELDVICVALPVDLNGLCAWSVSAEAFVVLIPPEHHWEDTKAIAAKQLAGEKLLLLGPGHDFCDQLIEPCTMGCEPARNEPKQQHAS